MNYPLSIRHCCWLLLAWSLGLGVVASAGEFEDRLAAWQNKGPRPTPVSRVQYQANPQFDPLENAQGMPATEMPSPANPLPGNQPAPSNLQGGNPQGGNPQGGNPAAPVHISPHSYGNGPVLPPGMPFGSYGCNSCGTMGGTGCGLLCGGGCPYLGFFNCNNCSGSCLGPGGGSGFGPGCGCGACGDCGFGGPLYWTKLDLLLYWRQGSDYPPLATTDPSTEDPSTAGILPGAQILFGNGRETSQLQAGMRIDFGTWLDQGQCVGIGDRFFFLGKDKASAHANSNSSPVLAIPFFNADIAANDALLVSYPGLRQGSASVTSSNEVLGNDLYAKFLMCRTNSGRIDFITGFQFSMINDYLRMQGRTSLLQADGNIPVGTTTRVFDQFDTRNQFYGGILGFAIQHNYCCWTVGTQLQAALGNMHQIARANGSTTIAVPGQNPLTTQGGLFTTGTNIGQISNNAFCVVPQADVTLGYQVNPALKLTFGYSFLYWSNVARAGNQIDPNIGRDPGATQPQLTFHKSDFWVQGLNFGAALDF
jgi:hypothetical protein